MGNLHQCALTVLNLRFWIAHFLRDFDNRSSQVHGDDAKIRVGEITKLGLDVFNNHCEDRDGSIDKAARSGNSADDCLAFLSLVSGVEHGPASENEFLGDKRRVRVDEVATDLVGFNIHSASSGLQTGRPMEPRFVR